MTYIIRNLEPLLKTAVHQGKSVLLLGPRQVGKTTLMGRIPTDLSINLIQPDVRQQYERDLGLLRREIEAIVKKKSLPIVIIDEIQKIPLLMDSIQDLIDRKKAQFILTGSSARKLKRTPDINLLPGRVIPFFLDPLTISELPELNLTDQLFYGSLPKIISMKTPEEKNQELNAYVTTYLEEEIRAEALTRNLGTFSRFLELAAAESNSPVNFLKLSQDIGVAHTTIMSFYQILEDCLIAHRIEPYTKSKTRKRLLKTHKYLFFDLGVRRLAAHEGISPTRDSLGLWFEQFVGLELIRKARLINNNIRIRFWKDPSGPEIDWVVEKEDTLIPVEVKLSSPKPSDGRHVKLFLSEYPQAKKGFVVGNIPRAQKLDDNIIALPWQDIGKIFD